AYLVAVRLGNPCVHRWPHARSRLVIAEAFDVGGGDDPVSNAVIQIEIRGRTEELPHAFQNTLRRFKLELPEFAHHDLLTLLGDLPLIFFQRIFNPRLRLRRYHIPKPVGIRSLLLRREDFNLVAVLENVVDRHELVIHLGADTLRSDRKSTRLNSSHVKISYAVFCLKKKKYTY